MKGSDAVTCHLSAIIIITASNIWLATGREEFFLSMISESQVYMVNTGESVNLECNFHADEYDMFERPVLWRKEQLSEDEQINALSNINHPFHETNRFEVSLLHVQSRYQLELIISNVSAEDTGNYTCEVRGTHSVVIVSVVHQLFVRAQVDNVTLMVKPGFVGRKRTDAPESTEEKKLTSVVRFLEGHPQPIRCIVHGGTPVPSVSLYMDRKDITGLFQLSSNVHVTGRKGLRRLQHKMERFNHMFSVNHGDDGSTLKCVASVPGLLPVYYAIKLDVDYEPKITCFSTEAQVGDTHVYVSCDVKAKPLASRMFWQWSNGTRLANKEVANGYWSVTETKKDDTVEAKLFIGLASPEMFRKYTLVAENTVGSKTQQVELLQFSKSQAKQPLSDAASTDMLGEKVSPISPMVLPQATPLTRAVKHSKKFPSSPSSIFPFEHTSRAHKLFHGAARAELVVASLVVVVLILNCYPSSRNKSILRSQVDLCLTSKPQIAPHAIEGDEERRADGSQSGIESGKIASVSAEERVGNKINSNPPALRNSISKKKSELFSFHEHSSNRFHLKCARNIKLETFSPVVDGRALHRDGKRPLRRRGFIVCSRLAIYFPAGHTEYHHHHCDDRQQKIGDGGNSRGTIAVRSSALKASCHETTKSTSKFSSYQFQNADSTSLLSTICTGR